jgi:malonyl-CoA O-methyltransferase
MKAPAASCQPPDASGEVPVAASRDARRVEYDAWAQTYPAVAHNPVMRAEQTVVEPLLRRLAPRRAVDVGTGSGRYLDLLIAIGATAVGVDFSMAMLTGGGSPEGLRYRYGVTRSAGLQACPRPGHRVCADARALPIRSASVGLVNASLMVGDIDDVFAWTQEMARVLEPGGHLLYSDFHPNWTRFGWRRTFHDASGAMHELPFVPHTVDEHRHALAAAGLTVAVVNESHLVAAGDRAIQDFLHRWGDVAVLVVLQATKR